MIPVRGDDSAIGKEEPSRFARSTRGRIRLGLADLVAVLAIGVFVFLATRDIRLPGLYDDECIQITPAMKFLHPDLPDDLAVRRPCVLNIGGHPLAMMTMDYIGAVKTVALIPVIALFGTGPAVLRTFTVLVAALSLWLIYLFGRRLLSPWAGALGLVLVCCDSSMIFFSRTDWGPTVFMMLFKAMALWALLTWWRDGKRRYLVIGALAMGLGVYDKANFLWVVGAIALGMAVVGTGSLWKRYCGLGRTRLIRDFALGASVFLIGCLPLVIYNLHWPMPTLAAMNPDRAHGVLGRLANRLATTTQLLEGRWHGYAISIPRVFSPIPLMVGMAAAVVVVAYLLPKWRGRWRGAMFVLICATGVLLAASATSGGHGRHHLIMAFPLPHLLLAAVIVSLARVFAGRQRIVGVVVTLTLLAWPVWTQAAYYAKTMQELRRTGGTESWSSRIYDLPALAETTAPGALVYCLDWGTYHNLLVASGGRTPCVNVWVMVANSPESAAKRLEDAVAKGPVLLVRHVYPPTSRWTPGVEECLATLKADGFAPEEVSILNDGIGQKTLILMRLSSPVR